MEASSAEESLSSIRIVKVGNCPTLSGRGKLEYHIGYTEEAEILFRVTSNSGGGYFSPEWVALKAMHAAMEKAPKPLTSFSLSQLFNGKSVNTPAFLFAALLAEGLVQRDEENPRVYISCSSDGFVAEVTSLIFSGVNIQAAIKITGKGVVKNRSKVDVVPVMKAASKGRPRKVQSA